MYAKTLLPAALLFTLATPAAAAPPPVFDPVAEPGSSSAEWTDSMGSMGSTDWTLDLVEDPVTVVQYAGPGGKSVEVTSTSFCGTGDGARSMSQSVTSSHGSTTITQSMCG
ncbi:hypothetical protein H9Y04_16255 [Streptomyces sp. TRM66268-LWL]|uniref:Uncharacterized protein n=1 Tax=Streptomyces polyasparticus TaxID=2767826 RepID=A0ABR7SHA8_9ACTN|nr:hypothetical protein [Streptomyces polyasparticus]MBC9714115.1 hypothetical protein [Streptomyces polyasparticus]